MSVFAWAGLRFGVVNSSSMAPTINIGELIFWTQTTDLHATDIAVYRSQNKLIAHRVVRVDEFTLTVKGDSANSSPETIPRSQVVGKFLFAVSWGR